MDTDHAIKNRKTQKFLAEKPLPFTPGQENFHNSIKELLQLASFAPHHKKCSTIHRENTALNSSLPWRTYVLDASNCRLLLDYITQKGIKAGKISNMLAAANGLLLVTWLPDPMEKTDNKEQLFDGNIKNMEHIAATSAAIQNILIGATAREIPNYWSSGGLLAQTELKTYLNIPLKEILLGAIFLFPHENESSNTTIKTGALREQGKELETWSKWINLQV